MENNQTIKDEKNFEEDFEVLKERKILLALTDAREEAKGGGFSNLKLPHEISISLDLTYKEMEDTIISSNNEDLRREWVLYRESLKINVSKDSKENKKDLVNAYNLGMGDKALPNITFIFDWKNDLAQQDLFVMIEQTKIAKMKMQEKMASLGIDVSLEDKIEMDDIFDEIDK